MRSKKHTHNIYTKCKKAKKAITRTSECTVQRLEKRRHAVEGPVLNPQYSLRNENKPNRPDASLKDAMVIQGYYI